MSEVFAQSGWLLPATMLLLGLLVGSFLNVVIYRLPLMMESNWRKECCQLLELEEEKSDQPLNLATPNSHCPSCDAAIKPWQNIPVISYLMLGGKCANCSVSISPRYPIIELITGVMSLVLALHFGFSPALAGATLLTWALITLTMIDVDHQLLPDDITLPLLWLGLLFNLQGTFVPLQDAVIGAAAGLPVALDRVLGVQTGYGQGRHGLRRLQAAGCAGCLDGLANAARHNPALLTGRCGVRHRTNPDPQTRTRSTHSLRSLPGNGGMDCPAVGRRHRRALHGYDELVVWLVDSPHPPTLSRTTAA